MNIPTWLKPAVAGAVVGGIATMIIGFNQGGWYTSSSAERLAYDKSRVAVIDALVPVCVSRQQVDVEATSKLAQLVAMKTSYEQRDFVMQSGWATMPATAEPNRELATACAEMLAKPAQS
jgi:hypothetical protein